MPQRLILVVRLGAMGDILHALPAAAALKRSFPDCRLSWAVHPKWRELLESGGLADDLVLIDRRRLSSLTAAVKALRKVEFDTVVDFQGLIQSALVARTARSRGVYGFVKEQVRERLAASLYTTRVTAKTTHVVEKNLDLAAAAGARDRTVVFPLPAGRPESDLPDGPFVLAAPFAGWASKQWPLEHYAVLARRLLSELGLPLVLNGAPWQAETLRGVEMAKTHISSISGLIDATRRATAVVGVDSGPMHLAAALEKSGVALFGPTDPDRNGPYGKSLSVIRIPGAVTSYQRRKEIDASMRAIAPESVFEALATMVKL
ncbi:glycosyltransferase family 9 protein [uncultured Paludibaculum sp.]|uniref:glycosyltransferase family 9 protein n=1 Tax=uncultured Paludibaculum sp. TaxID=1765020 RepID=UPI002AAAA83C|nr:glycosyltransferase family 9 protein [uncultured Paludibaculum sp.]